MGRAAKLDSVVSTALTLFASHGVNATAMPDLARAAGIGVGTIYRHFATKEELANHVYRLCKTRLKQALWGEELDGDDSAARFQQLWRRMVGFALNRPEDFRFLELHHHAGYLDPESSRLSDESMAPVVPFLQAAARSGAMRPIPVPVAIAIVWGSLVALTKAHASGMQPLDQSTIDLAGDCLWRALAV